MHFRLSNGLGMSYHVRGAGRIVLFLHPIGTRAAFWDGAIAHLGGNYRCITVDFRGHGDSDVPRQRFSLDDLADDVIELLRFERARDAIVVGCSLGGMVAQSIALKAPELLAGIVLADTNYKQTPEGRAIAQQRADQSLNGMPAMLQATLTRWFPERFLALNPPEVQACRSWLLDDDPVVFSWGWEAIRDLDYGERLRDIRLPALVLRGSIDASSQRATMQEMARLLPFARYVEIENGGHVVPLEKPEPFAKLLREFIEKDVRG
jgi:3-oxoadipate enol-lactonase